MVKKSEPFGTRSGKSSDELFKRKMTEDEISEARKLFSEFPMMDCGDVAGTIGVSKDTLRKYLRDECVKATERKLRHELERGKK